MIINCIKFGEYAIMHYHLKRFYENMYMIGIINYKSSIYRRVITLADDNNKNLPELLVLLVQNIKVQPFEKLLEICQPITLSVMSKYFLKGYDRDDFLQESRRVLINAANEYRIEEGMPFLQYYHMSLSNRLNMLVRKELAQKRKINMETFSLDELTDRAGSHVRGTSPTTDDPEEATIVKEMFESYIIELSPFEEDIFELFLKGLLPEEIGEELNLSVKQVTNALYRCSTKLRNAIN